MSRKAATSLFDAVRRARAPVHTVSNQVDDGRRTLDFAATLLNQSPASRAAWAKEAATTTQDTALWSTELVERFCAAHAEAIAKAPPEERVRLAFKAFKTMTRRSERAKPSRVDRVSKRNRNAPPREKKAGAQSSTAQISSARTRKPAPKGPLKLRRPNTKKVASP
jgi:hypothetical protein